MNCDLVRRDLSRALDGEPGLLAAGERYAHLAVCAGCCRFESESAAVSATYRSRVLSGIAALRRLEEPKPPRPRRLWSVPAAAAILLLAWSLHQSPPPDVGIVRAGHLPAKTPARSLLLELPRFFEEPDFEISAGSWWEPSLPVRLNDDLLPVFGTPSELPLRVGF